MPQRVEARTADFQARTGRRGVAASGIGIVEDCGDEAVGEAVAELLFIRGRMSSAGPDGSRRAGSAGSLETGPSVVLFVHNTLNRPDELFALDPATGAARRIHCVGCRSPTRKELVASTPPGLAYLLDFENA
jgi:hypothetical protein